MITLLAESYNRAYGSLVMAQQLSELEEIVEYKRLLKQTGVVKDHDKNLEDQEIELITQSNLSGGPSNSNLYRMRNPPGTISSPPQHDTLSFLSLDFPPLSLSTDSSLSL
jgi:hypothetical protein